MLRISQTDHDGIGPMQPCRRGSEAVAGRDARLHAALRIHDPDVGSLRLAVEEIDDDAAFVRRDAEVAIEIGAADLS